MTTYFITFANIFEAAAFKEFLETTTIRYKFLKINYFNYKGCSISDDTFVTIRAAKDSNIFSSDTIFKYKQVRKGITRYPILKF